MTAAATATEAGRVRINGFDKPTLAQQFRGAGEGDTLRVRRLRAKEPQQELRRRHGLTIPGQSIENMTLHLADPLGPWLSGLQKRINRMQQSTQLFSLLLILTCNQISQRVGVVTNRLKSPPQILYHEIALPMDIPELKIFQHGGTTACNPDH